MKRLAFPIILILVATAVVAWSPSQKQTRAFALYTATVEPGHLSHYMSVVEGDILPFLAEQEVEVVGIFRNVLGGPSNELVLLLAYDNLAHIQRVAENTTLTAIQQETFEAMRVLNGKVMSPVPFSPLR